MHRRLGAIAFGIAVLCHAQTTPVFADPCAADEIDRLFEGVCSTNILGLAARLRGVCERLDALKEEKASVMKRHAFGRLLNIPVSTNTFGFSYMLEGKALLVENAEQILGMAFGESEVRSVLSSAASLSPIPTNDLVRLRDEARERDRILYGTRAVGASWNYRANMAAWRQEKSRRMEWNRATESYRRRMHTYASNLLERVWGLIPEEERRRRVASFLAPFASADKIGTNEIERMLETGLAAVATDRRQGALGVLAEELWRHLDSLTTNHAVCVLLASARLQAFVEHELASVRVPERTVDIGPVLRAADGTRCRKTTVERARAAEEERRTIARTREYLCQLRHFSENYPNRIDADTLGRLYLSLNEDERREVMSRMVSILGRRPKWAPQREGGKR